MSDQIPEQDTLRPDSEQPEELEMAETRCIKCVEDKKGGWQPIFTVQFARRNWPESQASFVGIAECDIHHHQWPIRMHNNVITDVADSIDPIGTRGISRAVKGGLKQDLSEAARCYNFGLYKAAVVIARRACQLSFEDKIPNLDPSKKWTLGPLIDEARNASLISSTGFSHADIVLEFGNAGAHSAEIIEAEDARSVVRAAVRVIEELAPLASQLETGSNEQ